MSSWRDKLKEMEEIDSEVNRRNTSRGDADYDSNNLVNDDSNVETNLPQQGRPDSYFSGYTGDFALVSIRFVSIVGEMVLSHPCIVMRRQCQIRHDSYYIHLTPFTVIPVMFNIARNQGIGVLWKGLGSVFMVRGMGIITENTISEFTNLPRETTRHSSIKKIAQHLLLKSLSFAICAPFYAASLVEVVQSEIASDPPGLLSCLREGFARVTALSIHSNNRMLTVWRFVPPLVFLQLSHYIISSIVRLSTRQILQGDDDDVQDELVNDPRCTQSRVEGLYERYYCELLSNFTSNLVADILCYPLDTLIQRLCIQGTRTLIDNTDSGSSVAAINTAYSGFFDAISCMLREEGGGSGFYKGFGALILQYSIHFLLFRLARFSYERIVTAMRDEPPEHKTARPHPATPRRQNYQAGKQMEPRDYIKASSRN